MMNEDGTVGQIGQYTLYMHMRVYGCSCCKPLALQQYGCILLVKGKGITNGDASMKLARMKKYCPVIGMYTGG